MEEKPYQLLAHVRDPVRLPPDPGDPRTGYPGPGRDDRLDLQRVRPARHLLDLRVG